eukprot:TRINITY_DN32530_c0_g1_i1.p1 TRINITY_DN32530_c0_g1~~TRINITY_DN32530_c0_g1_i1.p1  ORF type:complete len:319 (+),score=93.42 TRINITY_DN32530_c0_g1_i1:58-1014(+)
MASALGDRPYRFALDAADAWKKHLQDEGYAVLAGVVPAEDVAAAADALWCDIEAAEGVSREDPTTWYTRRWHPAATGLVAHLAQTVGPWHVRGVERVQQAFGAIWGTRELITSMDAAILWRPWGWAPEEGGEPLGRKPTTEGLHLDQNPFYRPKLDCYQGMVPLLPVRPEVGGLQVVPRSHTDASRARLAAHYPKYSGDFIPLEPSVCTEGAALLEADPGDLILWDSRLIHGGTVGEGVWAPGSPPPAALARMAVTVAMTPRKWASKATLEARRAGFDAGVSFNHQPHGAGESTGTIHARRKKAYRVPVLNDSQVAVL